jgi:uncharacterized membrane protein (DUF373 family)
MAGYKSRVLRITEYFSEAMNLVLLAAIMVIIVGVVILFVRDAVVFMRSDLAHGIGTVFGTLLMLWVLMELLHTQLDYLRTGKLDLSIFVIVAMVAFIRKLMVASLPLEKIEVAYYPVATILVLGVVYYLVRKTEIQKGV